MLEDPKIIHFTTEWKPWHYNVKHPYRDEFFSVLDRTSWRNWRPGKPPFRIRRLVDRLMVRLIRQGTIAYRKLVTVRQEAR